jgi:hypothetical protein
MNAMIENLLRNAPPLGHPARPAWNRRVDAVVAQATRGMVAAAALARAHAAEAGDEAAVAEAGRVLRRARRIQAWAEGRLAEAGDAG